MRNVLPTQGLYKGVLSSQAVINIMKKIRFILLSASWLGVSMFCGNSFAADEWLSDEVLKQLQEINR